MPSTVDQVKDRGLAQDPGGLGPDRGPGGQGPDLDPGLAMREEER